MTKFNMGIPVTKIHRQVYNGVAIEFIEGRETLVLNDVLTQTFYPLGEPKSSVLFMMAQELWQAINNDNAQPFIQKFFEVYGGTTLEKEWSDLEARCGVTELSVLTEQWKAGFKFDFLAGLATLHAALQKAMGELGYHKAVVGTRVDVPIIPSQSTEGMLLSMASGVSTPEGVENMKTVLLNGMLAHLRSSGFNISGAAILVITRSIDSDLLKDLVTHTKTPDPSFIYEDRLFSNIRTLLKTDEFKDSSSKLLAEIAKIEKLIKAGKAKAANPVVSAAPEPIPAAAPVVVPVPTPAPVTVPVPEPVVLKALEISKLTDEKIQTMREFALGQFFKKARLAKLPGGVRDLFMQYMSKERAEASFNAAEGSMPDAVAMLALMVIMAFKQNEETGVALRRMGVWDNVVHAEKFLLGEETVIVPDVGPQQPHGVSSLAQAGQTIANTQLTRAPKVIV